MLQANHEDSVVSCSTGCWMPFVARLRSNWVLCSIKCHSVGEASELQSAIPFGGHGQPIHDGVVRVELIGVHESQMAGNSENGQDMLPRSLRGVSGRHGPLHDALE